MALWEFRGNIWRLYRLDIHLPLTETLPSVLTWLWWNSPAAADTKNTHMSDQTLTSKHGNAHPEMVPRTAASSGPAGESDTQNLSNTLKRHSDKRSHMNTCHSNSLFLPQSHHFHRLELLWRWQKEKKEKKGPVDFNIQVLSITQ